jgi:hypothetical protein
MTLPSNGLRIDHILLAVRADEPDVDDSIGVVDPHDDTILIAGDVKDSATIPKNAHASGGKPVRLIDVKRLCSWFEWIKNISSNIADVGDGAGRERHPMRPGSRCQRRIKC